MGFRGWGAGKRGSHDVVTGFGHAFLSSNSRFKHLNAR